MNAFILDMQKAIKSSRFSTLAVWGNYRKRDDLDTNHMVASLADLLLNTRGVHASIYEWFDKTIANHESWVQKQVITQSKSVAQVKRLFEDFKPFRKQVYSKFITEFMRNKQRVKHLLPLDLIASLCHRPAHRLPATQCVKAAFPLLHMKIDLTPVRVLKRHWIGGLVSATKSVEAGDGYLSDESCTEEPVEYPLPSEIRELEQMVDYAREDPDDEMDRDNLFEELLHVNMDGIHLDILCILPYVTQRTKRDSLSCAAGKGLVEVVRALIPDCPARVCTDAFETAINNGQVKCAWELLASGKVEDPGSFICHAARAREFDCIRLLLPFASQEDLLAALRIAVREDNKRSVEILIPQFNSAEGLTEVLDLATMYNAVECVKLLAPVSNPGCTYRLKPVIKTAYYGRQEKCMKALVPYSDPKLAKKCLEKFDPTKDEQDTLSCDIE